MQVTLNIPDELASRFQPIADKLPRILELGLQKWQANQLPEIEGVADVLETLAGLPSPEEVLALRPSPSLQERINSLLVKNRLEGLHPEEEKEWQQFQFLEHLVRIAKAKAALKLNAL